MLSFINLNNNTPDQFKLTSSSLTEQTLIAAEIQTKNKPICLINVYLSTKTANSDNQYQENLDILQTMLDKYVDSHNVIICGDKNGSLSNAETTVMMPS